MIRILKAEVLKLTTVRLWWVLILILVGYVAFVAALLGALLAAGDSLGPGANVPTLPAELIPPLVYSSATALGYVIPLTLGALSVTAEFRYQTLTPTFLSTPRRARVLISKVIVLAGAGAVFGVAGAVASIAPGSAVLAIAGVDPALDHSETWLLAARMVVAMGLWAVIGVGVGSLIPNQIASIVVVLAFTQFVEPILRLGTSVWDWTAQIGKFLPGAASDALVGSSIYTSLGVGSTSVVPLEWWQGGLVLLALGIALAVAGYFSSWSRDVT